MTDKYGYKEYPYEKKASLGEDLKDFFEDRDSWTERFLSPVVKTKEWDLITDEIEPKGASNIFLTNFFNKKFCEEVIKAAESNGQWTKKRHEFYPTTDMLIETIGMKEIYEEVLKEYLYPMAIHLWDLEGKTWKALESESFIIKYIPNEQAHLSFHHDHSLFTGLVTLNDGFEGGGTMFRRQKTCVKQPIGTMSLHPGNITHKHGARPITSGLRYVIVSFVNSNDP